MLPHVIVEAARDPQLRHVDIRILVALHELLALDEWRPLKVEQLVLLTGCSRSHCADALLRLAGRYVERGARAWHRGPYAYRLRYTCAPAHLVESSRADTGPHSGARARAS